tara:strand:- start:65427 stop:65705 length:279 start_codon:yes stop_codon:yes gene_type:complete
MELQNTTLIETVEPENELKSLLVDYVGNKTNPNDENVTVENIIDVLAKEFPEFLMAVAEENWVRGYQQALEDVEEGQRLAQEEQNETLHSGE